MADDKFLGEDGSGSKKKKSGPKAGAKAKPVAAGLESNSVDEVDAAEQTISLFLAVGLIVSALVVGLIVGYVVAPKGASNDFGAPAAAGTAPALTPDQLKSNQLPASHPPVPGLGGESSPSATETAPAEGQTEGSSQKPAEKSSEKPAKGNN